MHNLVLLAALALETSGGAASPPPITEQPKSITSGRICADTKVRWAKRAGEAQLRSLGELPPGDLTLAVVRDVGGCIEPAVVGYGYGAAVPRAERMLPRFWKR